MDIVTNANSVRDIIQTKWQCHERISLVLSGEQENQVGISLFIVW